MIGESFSGPEALHIGLLNYVVPKSELMAKAHELAATGPLAVCKVKEGVLRSSAGRSPKRWPSKTRLRAAVMTSKDARERPLAFKEKPAALHW